MSSTDTSTAGTPEQPPVATADRVEQAALLDAADTEKPSEAPTRVYLHPEQLAMIQTPEALPVPVLQRSALRVSYVPGIMPGKWFNRWHERYGDRVPLAEVPVREARGLDSLHQNLQLIEPELAESLESAGPAENAEPAPIERLDVPENPFAHIVSRPAPTARNTTASVFTRSYPWLSCRRTMCSPCSMRCP